METLERNRWPNYTGICWPDKTGISGQINRTEQQFHKDLKKAKKQGKEIVKLKQIMALLVAEVPLPVANKDHKLTGIYSHHLECHIAPDWLLIYKATKTELRFERTGSHSDLFKK